MRGVFLILAANNALAFVTAVSGEGQPLHWTAPVVQVALDTDAPEGAAQVLAAACLAWSQLPESRVLLEMGDGAVRVRFRRHDWPYAPEMLALTTVESHPESGALVSAVVEVNQYQHAFEIGGARASADAYDLQAVLTHELGHVLGLGHSEDARATMFASTAPWDTHQEKPDADDRAGIAHLYDHAEAAPPALASRGCSVASLHADDALGFLAMSLLWASLIWRQRQGGASRR